MLPLEEAESAVVSSSERVNSERLRAPFSEQASFRFSYSCCVRRKTTTRFLGFDEGIFHLAVFGWIGIMSGYSARCSRARPPLFRAELSLCKSHRDGKLMREKDARKSASEVGSREKACFSS